MGFNSGFKGLTYQLDYSASSLPLRQYKLLSYTFPTHSGCMFHSLYKLSDNSFFSASNACSRVTELFCLAQYGSKLEAKPTSAYITDNACTFQLFCVNRDGLLIIWILCLVLLVGWLVDEAVHCYTLKTKASICSETLAFTDSNPPVYELDLFLNKLLVRRKEHIK